MTLLHEKFCCRTILFKAILPPRSRANLLKPQLDSYSHPRVLRCLKAASTSRSPFPASLFFPDSFWSMSCKWAKAQELLLEATLLPSLSLFASRYSLYPSHLKLSYKYNLCNFKRGIFSTLNVLTNIFLICFLKFIPLLF